jgi:hypothetical protein
MSNTFKNNNVFDTKMDVEYIFYTVGVIFAIAAVLYFTWEYFFSLGPSLKITVLFLLTAFFWSTGNYLKERGV